MTPRPLSFCRFRFFPRSLLFGRLFGAALTVGTVTTIVFVMITIALLAESFDECRQRASWDIAQSALESALRSHPDDFSLEALRQAVAVPLAARPGSHAFLADGRGQVAITFGDPQPVVQPIVDQRTIAAACSTVMPALPLRIADPFKKSTSVAFSAACAVIGGEALSLVITLPPGGGEDARSGPPFSRLVGWTLPVVFVGMLLVSASTVIVWRLHTRFLMQILAAARSWVTGGVPDRIEYDRQNELGLVARAWNSLADALEARSKLLERTLDERRWFFATLAHDIRTPITAMRGALETARSSEQAAIRERLWATALRAHIRLGAMLGELRGIAGPEESVAYFSPSICSIDRTIAETVQALQSVADAQQLILRYKSAGGPFSLQADPGLIERVVSNLVMNAIRHTSAGGSVTVELNGAPDGVVIDIADTGEGIPAEDLPFIFDEYYRANGGRARGEGAGIGLAIARRFVELHGGSITVASSVGKGTRFSIMLPEKRPSASSPVSQSGRASPGFTFVETKVSILVFSGVFGVYFAAWNFNHRLLGSAFAALVSAAALWYQRRIARREGDPGSVWPPMAVATVVLCCSCVLYSDPSIVYTLVGLGQGIVFMAFMQLGTSVVGRRSYVPASLAVLNGVLLCGALVAKPELYLLGFMCAVLALLLMNLSFSRSLALNLWTRFGFAVSSALVFSCALYAYWVLGKADIFDEERARLRAPAVLSSVLGRLNPHAAVGTPSWLTDA